MHFKEQQVRALIAHMQETFPATRSLDLAFRACGCRLYCNSQPLLTKLQRHYQAFVQEPLTPDILITVLQTPPFLVARNYDLRLAGDYELIIRSEVAERLEGRLMHDPATGMLTMFDRGRYLIMGPGLEKTETIISFVYELYQLWLRSSYLASTPSAPAV